MVFDTGWQDKTLLTHELRTLDSWKKFNMRVESSIYKQVLGTLCPACDRERRPRKCNSKEPLLKCTCNQNLLRKLPHLASMRDVPKELLSGLGEDKESRSAQPQGGTRKRKAGSGGRVKRESATFELDGGAEALLGDEGLAPMRMTTDDLRREEKEDAAGQEGQERNEEEGEEGAEEDDNEDLEMADYAVNYFDDDEGRVEDEGGGSDDEENRYGTY